MCERLPYISNIIVRLELCHSLRSRWLRQVSDLGVCMVEETNNIA